jgi:hypothetical protein
MKRASGELIRAIELVVADRRASYPDLTPDEAVKDAYDNVSPLDLDDSELGLAYALVLEVYAAVEENKARAHMSAQRAYAEQLIRRAEAMG